jgi:hypothetical protein
LGTLVALIHRHVLSCCLPELLSHLLPRLAHHLLGLAGGGGRLEGLLGLRFKESDWVDLVVRARLKNLLWRRGLLRGRRFRDLRLRRFREIRQLDCLVVQLHIIGLTVFVRE